MIRTEKLVNFIKKQFKFFTGVPDSVLKNLINQIPNKDNYICSNEGSAVAMGIGYYLATKKLPLVYLQNSGLPNAINPLISIAHNKVYDIPLFLMIGWRGSPNSLDEPQHNQMGKITRKFLKILKIPYTNIRNESDIIKLKKLVYKAKKNKKTVACLVNSGSLTEYKKTKLKNVEKKQSFLSRKEFIDELIKNLNKNHRVISSTGFISREIYQARKDSNKNGKDFYLIGGMGHTLSVSLGYSIFSKKNTLCVDGDGSMLMHLGSMITSSKFSKNNLKYILINNFCHESVGKQPTYIERLDFKNFLKSIGFDNYILINNRKNLSKKIKKFIAFKKKIVLEVQVKTNETNKLLRPKNLIKIKNNFLI